MESGYFAHNYYKNSQYQNRANLGRRESEWGSILELVHADSENPQKSVQK
jgi:hypothetical protein